MEKKIIWTIYYSQDGRSIRCQLFALNYEEAIQKFKSIFATNELNSVYSDEINFIA